jgi:hypothetical protein
VNYENGGPAVTPEFDTECQAGCTVDACSCTAANGDVALSYWSSTSNEIDPEDAWAIALVFGGEMVSGVKPIARFRVRAVRGPKIDH